MAASPEIPPLAALLPELGVVVTGLAKVAAPGLRFGCIAGPARLLEPVRAEVHATSWPGKPACLGCRVPLDRGWYGDAASGLAARGS